MMEQVLDIIRREVSRALSRQFREVAGEITSYDPKAHAVKIKFKPDDDVESGWIPIRTLQTGKSHGNHMPPNVGDPVTLQFHGDDREAGTMLGAFFTDKHKPDDKVKAGEWKYIHKTKSFVYFQDDGTITVQGKNNGSESGGSDNSKQTVVLNKDGSTTVTDKAGQKIVLNGTDTITLTDAAGDVVTMKGGTITHKATTLVVIDSPKIKLGKSAADPVMKCDGSCSLITFTE